jgi:hypothetical protein
MRGGKGGRRRRWGDRCVLIELQSEEIEEALLVQKELVNACQQDNVYTIYVPVFLQKHSMHNCLRVRMILDLKSGASRWRSSNVGGSSERIGNEAARLCKLERLLDAISRIFESGLSATRASQQLRRLCVLWAVGAIEISLVLGSAVDVTISLSALRMMTVVRLM